MASSATSIRARWGLAVLVLGYALIDVMAGARDSPLVPALPTGVGPPRAAVSVARWLGLDRLSRTGLTLVSVAILAALVAAFAVVILEAWHGRVAIGAVLVATGIALALAVVAPVLLSRDVYSYAAYGRIFALHHANPYVSPPSAFPSDPFVRVASPEWIRTPSVYGPAFTLASGAVARELAGSVARTILAFKVIAAVSVGVAGILASVMAGAFRPHRKALAAAAVGLNPVVVVHLVGGGHNDALIALLFAAGLAVAMASRTFPGRALIVTALLTGAVLVKSIALPLLVLWLWREVGRAPRTRRARLAAMHLAVSAVLAAAAFAPLAAGGRTWRALAAVASRQGWASGPGLVVRGARALGHGLWGSAGAAAMEAVVVSAAVLLYVALFALLVARTRDRAEPDAWGPAMLLLALAAPYLLPWYAGWFVPFLGLMGDPVLVGAGFAAASLLALTGVPAEAGSAPGLWHDMVFAVHYVAAPVMLGILTVAARRTVVTLERRGAADSPPAPAAPPDAVLK